VNGTLIREQSARTVDQGFISIATVESAAAALEEGPVSRDDR
jgi:hypothetical protein